MSVRAGIVVTGTEVLTGRVVDRNGPWLSEQLFALGVDHAHTVVVGDRDEDMLRGAGLLRPQGLELIITSGGLGPTEDDRTAEIVGRFQGREMVLDEPTEARIGEILSGLRTRWPHLDEDAIRRANRKQAVVPAGRGDPGAGGDGAGAGRAAGVVGLALPDGRGAARAAARASGDVAGGGATAEFRAAVAGAAELPVEMLRLFGIPESEIAATLRVAGSDGVDLDALEITTCLRRGEIEIVDAVGARRGGRVRRVRGRRARAPRRRPVLRRRARRSTSRSPTCCGRRALSVACAESCTGGLLAARLTELAGLVGVLPGRAGVVRQRGEVGAGRRARLADRAHGAVSRGGRQGAGGRGAGALGADVGVGITGVAGPGGGTEDKPVGTVWLSVSRGDVDRRRG